MSSSRFLGSSVPAISRLWRDFPPAAELQIYSVLVFEPLCSVVALKRSCEDGLEMCGGGEIFVGRYKVGH